jgi:stage III sporulation protein AB
MIFKLFGAICIIVACGGFGFSLAASHRREEKCLQQLISGLDYMQCELQYHLTPLPDLCRQAARQVSGCIRVLLLSLAEELEDQISPDATQCMMAAINKTDNLPARCREALASLGNTLGRFDVEGQITGLEAVRVLCRRYADELANGREARLRSYQTLGLCAGAALVILFI